MNVLVDTSVWSLALRRNNPPITVPYLKIFTDLLNDGLVVLLGAIRQELLSGIRESETYTRLRDHLRAFPDLPLTYEDYETAAGYFNCCRSKGVQGAHTDFLICAAATRRQYAILTSDKDFATYQDALQFSLNLLPQPTQQ